VQLRGLATERSFNAIRLAFCRALFMTRTVDQNWPIIDFHAHIRPPWWTFKIPPGVRSSEADWYRRWGKKLTDPQALLREGEEGDVTLRLLSSTVEGVSGISGPVAHDEIRRHNDYLAELSAAHPGKLAALAAVDAFSGELAAREAERAITELGHVGIVIDSARDGQFAGSAVTRPIFEAAAQLKAPILVHPVAAPNTEALLTAAGRAGNSLGRGHVNGVAFLSILESGLLEEFPDLDVVFTGIGLGALTIAAVEAEVYALPARDARTVRPNLYFDFMGLDPSVLKFAIDILGPERVLVGSDWPIWESLSRDKLYSVFDRVGLSDSDRRRIAGGNAEHLLGRRKTTAPAHLAPAHG
jgi:predicted TIM-barrel fold metal-dependent hydrolase